MTVKTTTKAPGDPVKVGGKKLPVVTVTGDKYAGYSESEKDFLKRGNQNDNYVPGGGKYAKDIVRMTPDELEKFNEKNLALGGRLKYKEVRYNPNDPINKDGVNRYQGDYAHPVKDKKFYNSPKRFTPNATPKTPEKMEVGKLPTRKLTISSPQATLAKAPKKKEMVAKAIEGPKGQGRQFKSAPKAGKFTSGNRILKSAGTPGGGAEGRKFRKEEKLAGAYERTKFLADDNQGPNVWAGAFSKEKKAGYQAMRKDLRAARKETGVKVGSAIKDTRKAQKFEKKEQAGKTKYFTKSKMAETIEKKPTSKGKMQAGKMRYK